MRYRILASFQGAPYEAGVGPDESDVVLFAACPPPEELRFEPATGHWRKRVSRDQVQTLYESRPVGMFRGERCIVLDDLSDRLHIVYLGHDALRAAKLGYWEVDRGVFELITPRQEVTDIVEQRLPLPIRSDSGQHTRPGSIPSGRPDDYRVAGDNGAAHSVADSQPFRNDSGGRDEFATGPQHLDHRASRDGLPSSYSHDLPIAGLGRSESSGARPGDQSDVAIPLVPEAPLPLEAEALRAASSAARRGQKSSQSRQARQPLAAPTPPAPVPPPPPATPAQVPVGPAQASGAPAEAAAPAGVPVPEAEVPAPAAEASQPLPAPAPAAAMLSKAAMLSHAAATAARQAAASGQQGPPPTSPTAAAGALSTRDGQEGQPPAEAEPAPVRATEHQQDEEPEQPGPHDRTSRGPGPSSPRPEPAAQAPEPTAAGTVQAGQTGLAEATTPASKRADAADHLDQPVTRPVAANEPADAHAQDPAGPDKNARSGMPAAASAPPPAPGQDPPAPAGQDGPVSPEPTEPAAAPAADPATAPAAEPAGAPAAEAVPAPSAQAAPDHPEGTAGTPLVGISDPPSVAHPPPASAVPSWTPQGPVQPQPGFDAAQPAPAHDIAPNQAGYYAPYVVSEPGPRNGMATANGTAAAVDLGLVGPMPIQQPNLPPPSALLAQPVPPPPVAEMPEPAAEAEAEPGVMTRRRRSTKRRLPTQKIFSDLATQAAIPAAAFAIGEEVDGAMCLVRTDEGFEVFNAAAGARHEVRVFQDEESAYFYLFGVLVAESVRTGALVPRD